MCDLDHEITIKKRKQQTKCFFVHYVDSTH